MYFESRSGQDFYLWISPNVAGGPSAKFRVHNINTMNELSFNGNCLKGSRPILTFDSGFDAEPHMKLLKKMFTKVWIFPLFQNTFYGIIFQIFYVPKNHPKSKPYFDHIINFGLTADKRIWIRYYAIPAGDPDIKVEEIGMLL